MKRTIGLALALVILAGIAWAAGTAEVTRRAETGWAINWTSDAGGDVSATITPEDGYVARVTTMSDGDPTDEYDVALLDADGVDVLGGFGADRPTTVPTTFIPAVIDSPTSWAAKVWVAGPLTLDISNAGAAKTGRLTIYIERWRR